jgi:RHS repeat-associated protein
MVLGEINAGNDPDGDGVVHSVMLRFPGQYRDAESSLYYSGNRYYNPKTGRYIIGGLA